MHRFYVPNIAFPAIDPTGPDSAKRSLTLDGQLARQLKTVLRVGIGDRIGLFDGSGLEWEVQIDQVDRTEVAVRLISTVESVPEPFARVTMLLGLARPERIELAIQKCTELGAARFIPVLSERVQGGVTGAPSASRLDRWRRIAIEAAEQCGRAVVPPVDEPLPVMDAVNSQLAARQLFCMWEERTGDSSPLGEALKSIETQVLEKNDGQRETGTGGCEMAVLIGPPGGVSHAEASAIQEAGASLVTLGPRVLRSETAAIVVMSAILYEMGDLGG